MGRPRNLTDGGAEDAKRRMVFCLCADLTRSGEWLSGLPSFKSARFNVFFSQLLETYHSTLGVSRQAKYEGDAWLVATDSVEEVIALCFLALDLRRTFQRRAAEVLDIAEEDVPPLHLTICSGADVPVAPVSGHDWAGDSFRRAVRMSSRSCEGSILIDTPVYYLVRQDFATKYLTAVAVKSKKRVTEETIGLYELLDVQDSMKEVQDAPGIYIRGLRVLGRIDLADELTRRTAAHLQARTQGTLPEGRGALLPAWDNLLASAPDYDVLLSLFEALVHTKLAPDLTTYSVLIDRAPDYAAARDWFDRMEREGVEPDNTILSILMNRAADPPTVTYWRGRLEEKVAGSGGAPLDHQTRSGRMEPVATGTVFQETAESGVAPQESGSAVSVVIRTRDGHGARGAGIILAPHPLLILTASHLLAGIRLGSKVSLSLDGTAHRLLRVIPLPGPQAGLLSILACRGSVPAGKRSAQLPEAAIDLPKAQPVILELQRGGAFTPVRGEVAGVTKRADQESILLDAEIGEGDSGAPVFVNGMLAGVCQAKSGVGITGAAVVDPISQDSLVRLRRLTRRSRALYYAIRVGVSVSLAVALSAIGWGVFSGRPQGPPGCDPRPTVLAWLAGGRTYYNAGEPVVLHYRINKQCNVSLTDQIGDAPPTTLLDKLLRPAGDSQFRATASNVAGVRTLRVTVTDACGVVADTAVAFHVDQLFFDPEGPSTMGPSSVAEDWTAFDPENVSAHEVNGRWKVIAGSSGSMVDFGSDRAGAEMAVAIIRHYGINRMYHVDRPGSPFMYALVDGRAPHGPFPGEDCIQFDPAAIEVLPIGGRWKIVKGNHWMFDFGDNEQAARDAFGIIIRYGFTHSCFVSRNNPPVRMMYLRD